MTSQQKWGERCQALECGRARYLPSLIALLQYDMIGYYLFVCMIYVIVIFFSLYGSLLLLLLSYYTHFYVGFDAA